MQELKIIGDEVLRLKARAVTDFNSQLADFVSEMFGTMKRSKGIGLAAPQVGESIALFVTQAPEDEPRVFINPEIIQTSVEQVSLEEGCLSVPGYWAKVKRSAKITVQAQNLKGKYFKLEASGMLARVILHENDHLNGKLFIDYLSEDKKEKVEKKLLSKRHHDGSAL